MTIDKQQNKYRRKGKEEMKMKKYKEIIAMGFTSEMELNAFLSTIENDESISDLAYYNLRYAAIERFYENKEY